MKPSRTMSGGERCQPLHNIHHHAGRISSLPPFLDVKRGLEAQNEPLSPALSPLVPRGEREGERLRCQDAPHHASRITHHVSRFTHHTSRSTSAFTLMEVMVAAAVFFLAVFSILALVSSLLKNARSLRHIQV